jgi:LmbE family N-acetylglucosaminyl deacetylase
MENKTQNPLKGKKRAVVVCAHPDDETLFFAGLILEHPFVDWTIVCVTDGNADRQGGRRFKDFHSACRKLGAARSIQLHYEDKYSRRIKPELLIADLKDLQTQFKWDIVFTHSPIGDYGHPHHQDVSYSTHQSFKQVWSIGFNVVGDWVVRLSSKNFARKSKIIHDDYFSETKRFLQFLPISSAESFTQISQKESECIYSFFLGAKSLAGLKKYKWAKSYFKIWRDQTKKRPF